MIYQFFAWIAGLFRKEVSRPPIPGLEKLEADYSNYPVIPSMKFYRPENFGSKESSNA